MRVFTGKRLYATAFALTLALVLGVVTYISAAAGTPTLAIPGATATNCPASGAKAYAITQESPVNFSLAGYRENEEVAMYWTDW